MLMRSKKGQSTAEYAIVIGLVIAAVVAMQVYVKRGIQGKMKDATDYRDTNDNISTGNQFEPQYATTEKMVSKREGTEVAETTKGGGVTRSITGNDVSSRTGTSKISALP